MNVNIISIWIGNPKHHLCVFKNFFINWHVLLNNSLFYELFVNLVNIWTILVNNCLICVNIWWMFVNVCLVFVSLVGCFYIQMTSSLLKRHSRGHGNTNWRSRFQPWHLDIHGNMNIHPYITNNMCIYIHTHIYIYIFICIFMHTCLHVYMYTYIHIYIYDISYTSLYIPNSV